MGTRVCTKGMFVRRFDERGNEIASRFYARGQFTGKTPPKGPNPGSKDWLHDIHLADSDADLKALISAYPTETDDPHTTSGSSVGSRLILSKGLNGEPQSQEYRDQYVMATNLELVGPHGNENVVDTLMFCPVLPAGGASGPILSYFWDGGIQRMP